MSDKTALARQALRAAMQLRRNLAIPREAAVNAFDIAQMSGLDVRFLDVPSLEGMFVRDPGLRILLPCFKHRPRPRVLFSCAHEVGHYQFGHGTKADEYIAEGQSSAFSDEEFLANAFAAQLLMPRAAVMGAIQRRQWNVGSLTPQQVYLISGELGVGYETLLTHMRASLQIISRAERDQIAKKTPKAVKLEITDDPTIRNVVLVDSYWSQVPIDAERGDGVALPPGVGENCPLLRAVSRREGMTLFVAARPGKASLALACGEVTIRVARQHYVGPYLNRYLADPDEH